MDHLDVNKFTWSNKKLKLAEIFGEKMLKANVGRSDFQLGSNEADAAETEASVKKYVYIESGKKLARVLTWINFISSFVMRNIKTLEILRLGVKIIFS